MCQLLSYLQMGIITSSTVDKNEERKEDNGDNKDKEIIEVQEDDISEKKSRKELIWTFTFFI